MAVTSRRKFSGDVLGWGAGLLGATTTPRYLYPWYSDQLAEVGELSIVVSRPGILRNFRVRHHLPDGNGNPITYVIMVSGVVTPISVMLASTGSSGSDIANSIPVVTGDRISVLTTKSFPIGASPRNIVSTIDLV